MAKTFITQKEFIHWVNDMLKSYEIKVRNSEMLEN